VTESARFAPLSTDPAYRRIAQIITARITDRTLPEGQPLPTELELAGQFGVTRSTVREALRELESRGLVARRRGTKRLTVARPTTASVAEQISNALVLHDVTVLEVWEALTLLVPPTARLAATRRTPEDLQLLQAAAAAFAASGSTPRMVEAVAQFFEALEGTAANRALVLAHRPLLPLLATSLELMLDRVPQARSRISLAQRRIIEAVSAGDAAGAEEWMGKHIRDFRRGFEVAKIGLSTRVGIAAAPLPGAFQPDG
jgi:GntR family transcriptional regulator, transcriptional repressor for pyruvate dehydrogenase complex